MGTPGEAVCGFCHFGEESVTALGRLYKRQGVAGHRKCMQYSSSLAQYECSTFGGFDIDEVKKEIKRGSRLKCYSCSRRRDPLQPMVGATAGCSLDKCSKTFHFVCARKFAITKRMVITKAAGQEDILYRVFCKEDHLHDYLSSKYFKNNVVEYTEDSDENWDPESDEENGESHKSDTSAILSSSECLDKEKNTEIKEHAEEIPKPAVKRKMKPTRTAPQPSVFEAYNFSREEVEKDKENSITSNDRVATERQTRSQLQVTDDCVHDDFASKRFKYIDSTISFKQSLRTNSRSNSRKTCTTEQGNKQGSNSSLLEDFCEHLKNPDRSSRKQQCIRPSENEAKCQTKNILRTSPRLSGGSPLSVSRRTSPRSSTAKSASVHSPNHTSLSDVENYTKSVTRKVKHEESKTDIQAKKQKKRTLKNVVEKRHSSTNISNVASFDGNTEICLPRNEKIKKDFHSDEVTSNEDFVICILEDKYSAITDSLHITRMVQKQFVIAEHRMTRWKYGGDVELDQDIMLYFMRDITKALEERNYDEVYRLLFDLESKDLEWYQNHIDFNRSLGDLNTVLEGKLKESIVANLASIQKGAGERLGCVMNLNEKTIMLVFLVNDYIDKNYRIRSKLGHSFTTVLWNPSTSAKDLSYFTYDVIQYFNKLELKTMNEILEQKMKGTVFEFFLKPSDPLLQLKNTDRVSERLRYYLKLKRKKQDFSCKAQVNILFIGPLDTTCINTRAYCQKCIPLFIEENLTALKDVYVVVDLSVGCGIHTIEDLFVKEKLPPRCHVKVWSAFNPAIVPVTCVLAQFKIK